MEYSGHVSPSCAGLLKHFHRCYYTHEWYKNEKAFVAHIRKATVLLCRNKNEDVPNKMLLEIFSTYNITIQNTSNNHVFSI